MANYLLLFRSLTASQRAEKTLRSSGIYVKVTRVPSEIPTNGCSYCIRIDEKHLAESLQLLAVNEQTPKKVFAWFGGGTYREV